MKTCLAALLLAVAAVAGCQTRAPETTISGSRREDVFEYQDGRTIQTDPTSVQMTTTWKR